MGDDPIEQGAIPPSRRLGLRRLLPPTGEQVRREGEPRRGLAITYPCPEAALLLQIRKGELPYRQVAELLETGLERLEECQQLSTLPEAPDRAFAEDLVAECYGRQVAA